MDKVTITFSHDLEMKCLRPVQKASYRLIEKVIESTILQIIFYWQKINISVKVFFSFHFEFGMVQVAVNLKNSSRVDLFLRFCFGKLPEFEIVFFLLYFAFI